MEIKQFIETNKERFLEELFSLIRIPSVSAHSQRQPEMKQCAERWCELLLQAGVDSAEILPTTGNSVVFAKKMIDPSATNHYGIWAL